MKNLKVLFTVLCMLCTVGSWAETVTIYSEEFSASSNTLVTSCSASNFTGGVTPTAVNSSGNGWKLGTGNAGTGTGYSGGANLWSATNSTTVTFVLGDKLKNYTSVIISFNYYKGSARGSNNTFNLKFSSDGGSTFGDNVLPSNTSAASSWYSVEIEIPEAALANFAFRFTQTGTQTNRIDDIKIIGESGSAKTSVLTWSVAGDTSTETNGTVGTQLTESLIPANPEDLSCGTFVGWSATNPGNESESTTTTEPSDLFTKTTGTKPTPASEAVTYYAIFRKEQ